MPDVLKTVFEELLVDKHAGRAAGVGAIDDDLFLGSSASRAIFRLWKWIEPGMRLARNIHSSKQLTSLKSSPPSSFFFNPSRVMVRINRSKIKSNESRWQLDVSRLGSRRFPFRLEAVRVKNRRNQSWKALIDFCAAGNVVHLDPSTFAPNQTSLSEGFEMQREG
jgi:hypothetical protein